LLFLRRFLLLCAAALLIWRIGATGMSYHYAEAFDDGDSGAATKALVWDGRQPTALLRRALEVGNTDPDAAAPLLAKAYAENPADPRPLAILAKAAQERGELERADALVRTAVDLTPANPGVQLDAASYWAARGDLETAMAHWSLAMEIDPATKQQLIPVLLKLAEDPSARLAFRPFTASPPTWWDAFFSEVARRALDVETVRVLYTLRGESPQVPLTEPERQAYVARLQREGRITEAYIDWINGFSRERRAELGLIHDGGFELEPTNWGFDWQMRTRQGVIIDRARTYGIDGNKALHLLFDGYDRRFLDISQLLFLDPGPYRLTGRVRTDSLETQGGLKWVVRCVLPETQDLGETERFLGTNQWRDFDIEFRVPLDCGLQEIRLESTGKRAFEHRITGGAWFDRMAVRKTPDLAKVERIETASPSDSDPAPKESPQE
jgi:tetratricopeptide (TPR) repeat protein